MYVVGGTRTTLVCKVPRPHPYLAIYGSPFKNCIVCASLMAIGGKLAEKTGLTYVCNHHLKVVSAFGQATVSLVVLRLYSPLPSCARRNLLKPTESHN